ncbi:glutathione S-transferase [Burkholderia pseudomallei]|nr:glutathione S-transferase [Burkholderia pseudomallei]
MLRFFYHPSPNPAKVALFLEEAGVPYEFVPVDTRKGEQHSDAYKAINPNAKTPAIADGDAIVFDSNAILLYLAEKTGQFLPDDTPAARGELLSWLMFVATGIGPYCGQAVHFKHFAPEPKAYAVNRYDFEAWRHWRIVDERLAGRRYMVGERYTIADMAVWGWARPAAQRADALKARHAFKVEFDDEARRALFPQNARLAATAGTGA